MKLDKFINAHSIILACCVLFGLSCKKDWLDVKQNKSLLVPSTLKDFQALLDNEATMNLGSYPALGEIGSDNFILQPATLPNITSIERNAYVWAANVFEGSRIVDWETQYAKIYNANLIIEGMAKIPVTGDNRDMWNNVMGAALFCRAFAFFNLLDLFANPYDSVTAATDLGIPLRMTANINDKVNRSSVQACYDQVLKDLQGSAQLLPDKQTVHSLLRPDKAAAYGLLARFYLTTGKYALAALCADSSLKVKSDLLDYNELNANEEKPIPPLNKEIMFYATFCLYMGIQYYANIPATLYELYEENDLRKGIYFKNTADGIIFKASYGYYNLFGGIATDEIYLTRAEGNARSGKIDVAMEDLNTLLSKRWKTGTFVPLTASNAEEALRIILLERRKELILRGIRWFDLRRLNKDPRLAVTLSRSVSGHTYTLSPNDKRYVYPIPDNEVLYSGIPQNPR